MGAGRFKTAARGVLLRIFVSGGPTVPCPAQRAPYAVGRGGCGVRASHTRHRMVVPEVLRDPTLSGLLRAVCRYAGIPVPPATTPGVRFVLRSGPEPPDLLAKLL